MLWRLAASSAVIAALALAALPARPARSPRYGGTLRVEIGPSVGSIDPNASAVTADEAAAKREIESLIYEKRNADGSLAGVAGSGPFRISEWEPGKELVLAANDDFSGGRPFVDSVEIDMGRSVHDRLVDLELGRTDFSEIPAEDARQAATRGVRITASPPDELIAVIFLPGHPAVDDARVREAIASSINRAAIVDFILQKEGEPAGGLLPQWSSGTAFLFATDADVTHAKELRTQISGSPQIRLGYDSGDSLEESIAERIAVDAHEAGLAVATGTNAAAQRDDARLVRLRMGSPQPGSALAGFLGEFDSLAGLHTVAVSDASSAEQVYDAERAALEGCRIVPLVWLPRVYGLSDRVRDWQPPTIGQSWPLADVWLDTGAGSSGGKQN
ncbi:MAG TPA: ABC transporter substrate-binding protein [Candidatus Acidoferrales bacterium]